MMRRSQPLPARMPQAAPVFLQFTRLKKPGMTLMEEVILFYTAIFVIWSMTSIRPVSIAQRAMRCLRLFSLCIKGLNG
jgi:hypothetical protein